MYMYTYIHIYIYTYAALGCEPTLPLGRALLAPAVSQKSPSGKGRIRLMFKSLCFKCSSRPWGFELSHAYISCEK